MYPASHRIPTVLFMVAFGALTTLGSGGGGGGNGEEELVYVGNTDPAQITAANATRAAAYIFGGIDFAGTLPTAAVAPAPSTATGGLLPLVRTLRALPRPTPSAVGAAGSLPLAASIPIDETEQCYPSGYSTLTGSIDDVTGTGTLTIAYYDCYDGEFYIDGTVTWRINEAFLYSDDETFMWQPLDSTFTFKVITVRSPEFDISLGGTLRDEFNIEDGSETLTLNAVTKDNDTGYMQKTENVVIVSALVDVYLSQTVSGRFYDSVGGYVNVATLQALLYTPYDAMFPSSGQLRITGADNARLRATALSDVMALLELDLNDDTVYEITGEIPWEVIAEAGTDPGDLDGDGLPDSWEGDYGLSNETYADASEDGDEDTLGNYVEYLLGTNPTSADTDADGMPDGWEVGYGLNPLDDSDAAGDADGDEATNLQEYTYGTDPTDPLSTPADLAVSKSVSLNTVSAQTLFEYTLNVTNQGPGTARGVSLTDTVPDGAEIYAPAGYLPVAWDCVIEGNTLTCQPFLPITGVMTAGENVSIAVPVIAPAATGDITNTATIESTTLDFDDTNDAASVDTTIASAVLNQIDVEYDGVDGVDGLSRPFRLALSPGGEHIYVPAITADALLVFARNVDGTLDFVEAQRDGLDTADQPDFPKAAAVSPDGNNVYLTTEWDSKLIVYSRNSSTGALTYVETHQNGLLGVTGIAQAIAVTVSADGKNVYVAGPNDNAVAVFNRNTSTGALTFSTAIVDGVGGVAGLVRAFDVELSPDDAHLYVAGNVAGTVDGAIAVFSRDLDSGALTYVGLITLAAGPEAIAVSTDGEHLYAANGGLVAFARDNVSGALTYVATYGNGQGGVVGMEGIFDVAIAPDGSYVHATARTDNALGTFVRDPVSGELRFIEAQKDGIGSIEGLGVAWALAVSPDSAFVYVSAGVEPDSAVSAFSVDLAAER